MICQLSKLRNGQVLTEDRHPIGRITDLLFEPGSWLIRYIVIGLSQSNGFGQTIISPAAIIGFDHSGSNMQSNLCLDQVFSSPVNPSENSVSRNYENQLAQHYDWPAYWRDVASGATHDTRKKETGVEGESAGDKVSLLSAFEISRFRIESKLGPVGLMSDLILDLQAWTVKHAVADRGTWLPRASSIIDTNRINRVNWQNKSIQVDLSNPNSGRNTNCLGDEFWLDPGLSMLKFAQD